jgi:hypothetical protein
MIGEYVLLTQERGTDVEYKGGFPCSPGACTESLGPGVSAKQVTRGSSRDLSALYVHGRYNTSVFEVQLIWGVAHRDR